MNAKRFITAVVLLLFIKSISAQTTCPCDCAGNRLPAMVIPDDKLASDREAAFKSIKRKFLMSNFVQEISLNFNDMMTLFGKAASSNASGLRVYFTQHLNKPGELDLLFVPTQKDLNHTGWEMDQANEYRQIKHGLNQARLQPISNPKVLIGYFRDGFKRKSDADAAMTGVQRKETTSIFYSQDKIKELYNAIQTGCLKGVVKGVGVKFVAYRPGEDVLWPDGSNKPCSNQLLIHFVFYDCNNNEINFRKCYGFPIVDGDVDTGLPCPDFCNGGEDSFPLKLKKS